MVWIVGVKIFAFQDIGKLWSDVICHPPWFVAAFSLNSGTHQVAISEIQKTCARNTIQRTVIRIEK